MPRMGGRGLVVATSQERSGDLRGSVHLDVDPFDPVIGGRSVRHRWSGFNPLLMSIRLIRQSVAHPLPASRAHEKNEKAG